MFRSSRLSLESTTSIRLFIDLAGTFLDRSLVTIEVFWIVPFWK